MTRPLTHLFFTLLAVCTCCGAENPSSVEVQEDRPWTSHHFAMSNWFYTYQFSNPELQVKILAESGYQGIMLSLKDDPKRWAFLPRYLKALKKHDMTVTAIHCRFHIEDGTYPQVIKDHLPLLKDSGVILIPSVGSRQKLGRRDPEAVAMAVNILREMSEDVASNKLGGIAPYMHINNWLETVDDGIFIAEQVARRNVGVMFHLHHWTTVEQREHKARSKEPFIVDQAKLSADLAKAKPYLMAVVVQGQDHNNATHKIVGEGSFDLTPLVRTLADIDYRGPLGTMGYTQGGDIPDKLHRAALAWTRIKEAAKAPTDKPAGKPADKASKHPPPAKAAGGKAAVKTPGIGIKTVTASASQVGYPPSGAVDADASTRWSVLGTGHWLQIELEEPVQVERIGLGFTKGTRRYQFGVAHSEDGTSWSAPTNLQSSGAGDAVVFYPLKPMTTRFIRVLANGNNANAWNNIHTVHIPGVHAAVTADTSPLPSQNQAFGKLKGVEFAKAKMVGSVVGISVDTQGHVYVTQTNRRGIPMNDIRKNPHLVEETLSARTMEDKRRLVKAKIRNWQNLEQRKELIIKLTDSDGDGQADQTEILHAGFNSEVHGLAGGVLHHQGSLYVACIPGFYKLTDRNHDGRIDDEEVEELVTGLGINIGYGGHDMHGPTLGPDGRIYWSIGDKGFSVEDRRGTRHYYPGHGAVFRIEPDGRDFEVFAHGLRNPQELAFDEYGNLFTVDNDADIGDRERVHFVVEGTDSGWRAHHQVLSNKRWRHLNSYNPWMKENLWKPKHDGQAAYITPAIANYSTGPIGFAYNPGTALSPRYYKTFFLAESNKQLVGFKLSPKGAGFTMHKPERLLSGTFATGINFGPDGALYLANWGNNAWAPHNNGSVVKLDDPTMADNPLRQDTRALLAANPKQKSIEELGAMLAHADQRVRLAAQLECVKRGATGLALLRTTALHHETQLARIHAIWGIGQAGRETPEALAVLLPLFDDADPEIVCQVAKVMGDARFQKSSERLNALILHPTPRVQLFAALAASKLSSDSAFANTVTMLSKNADKDPFVRHAGVLSLVSIAKRDTSRVLALAKHESVAVRLAAVVALRRLQDPALAVFLQDADTVVRLEAARAIHDDLSVPQALPALAAMLNQSPSHDEAIIRRCISAHRRLAGKSNARAIADYAANAKAPTKLRLEALETLSAWPRELKLDRIQAFHRGLPPASREDAATAIQQLARNLNAGTGPLGAAIIRMVAELNDRTALPQIEKLALDPGQAIEIRKVALEAMVKLKSEKIASSIGQLMSSDKPELRAIALSVLSSANPDSDTAWNVAGSIDQTASISNQRHAIELLGKMKKPRATAPLQSWLDAMISGTVQEEVRLDVYNALHSTKLPAVQERLPALDRSVETLTYGRFQMALAGGNVKNGRELFHRGASAQCLRCHEVLKNGPNVGPDLKGVARKYDHDYLLRSIIKPSADIADENRTHQIDLKDGEVMFGRILSDAEGTIVVALAPGESRTIQASEIKKKTAQTMSTMPDFSLMLPVEDVRDLMAYLGSLTE